MQKEATNQGLRVEAGDSPPQCQHANMDAQIFELHDILVLRKVSLISFCLCFRIFCGKLFNCRSHFKHAKIPFH